MLMLCCNIVKKNYGETGTTKCARGFFRCTVLCWWPLVSAGASILHLAFNRLHYENHSETRAAACVNFDSTEYVYRLLFA